MRLCSQQLFLSQACDFCPSRIDTGIPCAPYTAGAEDDASTHKCEPFCAMAHAEAHCELCKCSACSFCLPTTEVCELSY